MFTWLVWQVLPWTGVVKILHVIPSVSQVHGGPTHALAVMERSLTKRGLSVTTVTTDDDGAGHVLSGDARPADVDGVGRFYAHKWSEFYKVAPGLLTWLLRHVRQYDVVHIHALFSFSSGAAAVAAWMRGVPYIIRPLGTLNRYSFEQRRPVLKAFSFRLIESQILSGAAAVHFTSQAECDEAIPLGIKMRGVVIPLGVDAPPIRHRKQERSTRLLFLSRLDPKKNVDGLIRAFAIVHRSLPEVELVIAGDGPADYVRRLHELAEAEGLGDSLRWAGYVSGEAKWRALSEADIFVLPSHSENFGIAVVEALLAGLPCVVGRGVAIAETVADGGAGLVTDSDPFSIADTMFRLIQDQAMRQQMGNAARVLAQENYSSTIMAERLEHLYRRIISGGALPSLEGRGADLPGRGRSLP